MYESFFEMEHTPFVRNIPADRLYTSVRLEDALGRLKYSADHQQFAVVMADPGCGKSTLVRRFAASLPADKYMTLYLSDSNLKATGSTPAGCTNRKLLKTLKFQ